MAIKNFSDISLADNVKLLVGTGNDLQIYHNGGNSFVDDAGTGDLRLRTTAGTAVKLQFGDENFLVGNANSRVQLYFNNVEKLVTKSDGVDITGELQCDTLDVDGAADISGALTMGARTTLHADGTITWGAANDYGLLSGDTGYALIYGKSGKGIKFATNGTTLALQLDTSQNATFAGTIGSGAITSTGKIQGTELEGTSLDINGAAAINGKVVIEGDSADWSETTPGTTTGSLHFDPGSGTNDFGNAITFGASDSGAGGTAQAGIYLRTDGQYGSKMYFATTDNYSTGAKVAMYINKDKDVYFLDDIKVAGEVEGASLDINGAADISGALTTANTTITGDLTFGNGGDRTIIGPQNEDLILNARPNGSDEGLKIQIGGTDKLSVLQDGGTTFAGTLTVGVDDTGHDVKFFGATSGKYMQWDESQDRLEFTDTTEVVWGTDGDLNIVHDGTDGKITEKTGHLYIRTQADDKDVILQSDDGSGGTTAYLTLDGSQGFTTVQKDIQFADNVDAHFGAGSDMILHHNGTDNFIQSFNSTTK